MFSTEGPIKNLYQLINLSNCSFFCFVFFVCRVLFSGLLTSTLDKDTKTCYGAIII